MWGDCLREPGAKDGLMRIRRPDVAGLSALPRASLHRPTERFFDSVLSIDGGLEISVSSTSEVLPAVTHLQNMLVDPTPDFRNWHRPKLHAHELVGVPTT